MTEPTMTEPTMTTPPSLETDQKPRRRRRTREEIEADQMNGPQSGTSGSRSGGKIARELGIIKKTFDSIFVGTGTLLSAVDQFDGAVLMYGGPNVSEAIVTTAENDAKFREYMLNFCQATGYTQLVTAVMGLVLPMLAHHGLGPMQMIYMAPERAVDIEMARLKQIYERTEQNKAQSNGVHI